MSHVQEVQSWNTLQAAPAVKAEVEQEVNPEVKAVGEKSLNTRLCPLKTSAILLN